MKEWRVDITKLVELVAERMYSDPVKAGIRELITNSLDARIDLVEIELEYSNKKLRYSDTGIGIDPEAFKEVYGKIASSHERKKESRGIFGIGRMSLIAASKRGKICSYKEDKIYEWSFDKSGWTGPEIRENTNSIQNGIYLEFEELDLGDEQEIEKWIRKTFSLPLLKKECSIKFNGNELFWVPQDDYTQDEPIETKYGKITIYFKEEMDGILYVCQKGILVKEEPYAGLTAWIDQDFLDIKTDREGFLNNEKYRFFNSVLKKQLSILRPTKSFEKMEVDFIRRLMREFKRYWETKTKTNHVMEKLELVFPQKGEEIVAEENLPKPEELEGELPKVSPDNGEQKQNIEEIRESGNSRMAPPSEVAMTSNEGEVTQGESKVALMEEPLSSEIEEKPTASIQETSKQEEERVVKIKGAKPADLGENYPMIFFESEPFVLVFNTSHPLFRRLVEQQKLGVQELAILFERMMESAYYNENLSESPEKIKERWKTVDKKLINLFMKEIKKNES